MLCKKIHPVVGLTTFNTELLQISIPALGKINQKFTLIVHNDNPGHTVTRNTVRRLGYRGALHIINSDTNVGLLRARMAIAQLAKRACGDAQWIMFADDDDIVTGIETPCALPENFAVIQNMLVLRTRMLDVLRAVANPESVVADGNDIVLQRPHVGFVGTLMRMNVACEMMAALEPYLDKIAEIDASLDYVAPWDAIMWSWLRMYAAHKNTSAVPIFMDKINYIKVAIDTAAAKYGRAALPAHQLDAQYAHAVARFDAVLKSALATE